MNILHLTLNKRWFDMIESGEKTEEYREQKEYWFARLMHYEYVERNNVAPLKRYTGFKKFDVVEFKNGYAKDARTMQFECKGIKIGWGKSDWGAEPFKDYFIMELGKRIN